MDWYNPAELYDVHRIVGLVVYYIYWMFKQK